MHLQGEEEESRLTSHLLAAQEKQELRTSLSSALTELAVLKENKTRLAAQIESNQSEISDLTAQLNKEQLATSNAASTATSRIANLEVSRLVIDQSLSSDRLPDRTLCASCAQTRSKLKPRSPKWLRSCVPAFRQCGKR